MLSINLDKINENKGEVVTIHDTGLEKTVNYGGPQSLEGIVRSINSMGKTVAIFPFTNEEIQQYSGELLEFDRCVVSRYPFPEVRTDIKPEEFPDNPEPYVDLIDGEHPVDIFTNMCHIYTECNTMDNIERMLLLSNLALYPLASVHILIIDGNIEDEIGTGHISSYENWTAPRGVSTIIIEGSPRVRPSMISRVQPMTAVPYSSFSDIPAIIESYMVQSFPNMYKITPGQHGFPHGYFTMYLAGSSYENLRISRSKTYKHVVEALDMDVIRFDDRAISTTTFEEWIDKIDNTNTKYIVIPTTHNFYCEARSFGSNAELYDLERIARKKGTTILALYPEADGRHLF